MDVLFLCGLCRRDLALYYTQHFKHSHQLVLLDRQKLPEVAAERIVPYLARNQDVVVIDPWLDDEKLTMYTEILMAAMECSFKYIELQPKFGQLQLDMVKDFHHCKDILDGKMSESCCQIARNVECENVEVEDGEYPPMLEMDYKFEVPALVMEYPALLDSSGEVHANFHEVLRIWTEHNSVGCVVMLSNGKQDVRRLERRILDTVDCPIYLFDNIDLENTGQRIMNFIIPFLRVDVQESSVLFKTTLLRQFANQNGIGSCEAEKVLELPGSVIRRSTFSKPEGNVVLDNLQLKPCLGSPALPLCDSGLLIGHRMTKSIEIANFCRITLLVKDQEISTQFSQTYKTNATRVGDEGNVREYNEAKRAERESTPLRKKRSHLPEWMAKAAKKTRTPEKNKAAHYQTEYIMDERELLQFASEVLKESSGE